MAFTGTPYTALFKKERDSIPMPYCSLEFVRGLSGPSYEGPIDSIIENHYAIANAQLEMCKTALLPVVSRLISGLIPRDVHAITTVHRLLA